MRASDLTLLCNQNHGENEKEGMRERVIWLNVALTFRSGQHSKWHADRFTGGFQRGPLSVF